LFLFRYSAKGLTAKKVLMLNKSSIVWSTTFSGIWDSKRRPRKIGQFHCDVALVAVSFTHCDVAVSFTATSQSPKDKVMHIIRIISIIRIILITLIIRIICRLVRILYLQTTCGRTRGPWLPNPLITWAISFVLPCVPDGFHTSVVRTQRTARPMPALLWEK
jgi:hypothetical protein